MKSSSRKPGQDVQLGSEALEEIATTLSDLYQVLYGEPATQPHASLTGNMLAFVFEDGLSVPDEWLLRVGKGERLEQFRRHFFEVVRDEMVGVASTLTGRAVTYSFYGFDPTTRTTHAVFVLDLSTRDDVEERRAILNWSEQVRRNAQRLHRQHAATREAHEELAAQVRSDRDVLRREDDEVDAGERRSSEHP